ncbi:hypothetical protein RyT2_25210 [Pseudolactococcus yaeyamensis]
MVIIKMLIVIILTVLMAFAELVTANKIDKRTEDWKITLLKAVLLATLGAVLFIVFARSLL